MNPIKKRIQEWGENLSLLEGQDRLIYLIDLAKNKKRKISDRMYKSNLGGCHGRR